LSGREDLSYPKQSQLHAANLGRVNIDFKSLFSDSITSTEVESLQVFLADLFARITKPFLHRVGSLFTLRTGNCACIYCALDKYSAIDRSHWDGKRQKNFFSFILRHLRFS
jgi:hypothetical protein